MKRDDIDKNLRLVNEAGRLEFPTSGTTSIPKRVCHSAESMVESAQRFIRTAGVQSDIRMFHCLPSRHMGGFLNTVLVPLLADGEFHVEEQFNPALFWRKFNDAKCNAAWFSPTMAKMLIALSREDKYSRDVAAGLRYAFCGFAPLDSKTRREWIDVFGTPLRESYGTSELMFISVQTEDSSWEEENVGVILSDLSVAIEVGTSQVMVLGAARDGYYVTERGIEHFPESFGYICTGDTGESYYNTLTITGRIKDIIKVGGETVSPRIIEETIMLIDGINDVAVIGIPDEIMGEKVVAFVNGDTKHDIASTCRERLGKSHSPSEVIFVNDIPRGVTGKVSKSALMDKM